MKRGLLRISATVSLLALSGTVAVSIKCLIDSSRHEVRAGNSHYYLKLYGMAIPMLKVEWSGWPPGSADIPTFDMSKGDTRTRTESRFAEVGLVRGTGNLPRPNHRVTISYWSIAFPVPYLTAATAVLPACWLFGAIRRAARSRRDRRRRGFTPVPTTTERSLASQSVLPLDPRERG